MKAIVGLVLLLGTVSYPKQDADALIQQLRDGDLQVRERAFAELEKLGAAAEAALRAAAKDSDATFAAQVGRLVRPLELERSLPPRLKAAFPDLPRRLGRGPAEEWTQVYLAVFRSKPDAKGQDPFAGLTRADLEPLAEPALRAAITKDDKVEALEAASRWHHRSAEPAVRALLHDTEYHVLRQSVDVLRDFHGPAALKPVLEELSSRPSDLLIALERLGTSAADAKPRILDLTKHENPKIAAKALELARSHEFRELIEFARQVLAKGPDGLRIPALDYLETMGDRPSESLVRPLLSSTESDIRYKAAMWLKDLGFAIAESELLKLLDDSSDGVAQVVLVQFKEEPPATAALRERYRMLARTKDSGNAHFALTVLAKLRDPSVPELAAAMAREGENEHCRDLAMDFLAKAKPEAAAELLPTILANEKESEWIRERALLTLSEVKRLPSPDWLAALIPPAEDQGHIRLVVSLLGELKDKSPELAKPVVRRLLREEKATDYHAFWYLLDVFPSTERKAFLLEAIEEVDRSLLGRLFGALAELKDKSIVPELREFLRGDDHDLQGHAIDVLVRLDAAEARPDFTPFLASPVAGVRSSAVLAVNHFGIGDDLPAIRKMVSDPDPRVRWCVAEALLGRRSPEDIPILLPLLDDPDEHVWDVVACGLLERRCPSVLPALFRRFHDDLRDWRTRKLLGVLAPESADARITELLEHRDSRWRRLGIYLMATWNRRTIVARLLPQLSEPETAGEAADVIVALGARELAGDLRALVERGPATAKRWAVKGLAGLEAIEAVPSIRVLMRDAHADVRSEAAKALGLFRDRESVGGLVSLLKDPSTEVSAAAIEALAEIGDSSVGDALFHLLEEHAGDPYHPHVWALVKLRPPGTADRILALARQSPVHLAFPVYRALGKLGVKEAIPDLLRMLERPGTRGLAAGVLADLGAREALPTLARLAEGTEDPSRLLDIAEAMSRLGESGPLEKLLPGEYGHMAAEVMVKQGDRRVIPRFLDTSEECGPVMNKLRDPVAWKKLTDASWRGRCYAPRVRILERVAEAAGLKLEWSKPRTIEDDLWRTEFDYAGHEDEAVSLASVVIGQFDVWDRHRRDRRPRHDFILEGDTLRIVTAEKAVEYWKKWWAGEKDKK
jgi:HEAT repeat protein